MKLPTVLVITLVAMASGRLTDPSHQLAVASAAANPEIDSWHAEEQRKIEEDCNGMMRKLWAQKRQKLADLVAMWRKRVEEERARLAALKAQVQNEVKELESAKTKIQAAKKIDLQPTLDAIAATDAKIREVERLIAEKQACIEELRKAEADLAEALRRLDAAQRKLSAAEADVSRQKGAIRKEEGDIAPAQADVDAAEEDLNRAKARNDAAQQSLSRAKGDLAEHDNEGSHGAVALPVNDVDAVPEYLPTSSEIAPPAAPKPVAAMPTTKSAAQGSTVSAVAASFLVSLLM